MIDTFFLLKFFYHLVSVTYGMSGVAILYVEIYVFYIKIFMVYIEIFMDLIYPIINLNPFKPKGISHSYKLDQSISVVSVTGWYF